MESREWTKIVARIVKTRCVLLSNTHLIWAAYWAPLINKVLSLKCIWYLVDEPAATSSTVSSPFTLTSMDQKVERPTDTTVSIHAAVICTPIHSQSIHAFYSDVRMEARHGENWAFRQYGKCAFPSHKKLEIRNSTLGEIKRNGTWLFEYSVAVPTNQNHTLFTARIRI